MDKKNKINYTSEARTKAHKKYMSNFVEVKVRMTPDKRQIIQEHALNQKESTTAFINRAIDETMEHDTKKLKEINSDEELSKNQ